jgi:hypothetical protein
VWKLQLCGDFELRRPDGISVPVANRKVQALLSVLAIHRESGVGRGELAAILWPELSVAKRGNNLRQTLLRAREVIGHDAIVSSRTDCRFSNDLSIEADVDSGGPRGLFMPGFDGPWFDRIRQRGVRSGGPTLLTSSFLNLLEWFSDHDPARMLGLMRENLGMTLGMSTDDRRRILERVADDRALPGWLTFFRAQLLDQGYAKAAAQFRELLTVAELHGDHVLGVQVAAQLVNCSMMQNRIAEALTTAAWCMRLAEKSGDPSVIPTATQIQAMALLHGGRPAEGFLLLERAEQQYSIYLDSVIMQALRGYHLLTYGRMAEADQCMEIPRKVRNETGHGLLQIICSIVDAKMAERDRDPRDSIEGLLRAAETTNTFEDRRYVVVAHEELAMAYGRVGEVDLAKERAVSANRIRRTMAMGYTPWDQLRLATRS